MEAVFWASALAVDEELLRYTSAKTIAITTGIARVAIQKPRFFRVRMNSNSTTVPRLCRANGAFRDGDRGGLGRGGALRFRGVLCHRVQTPASSWCSP